MKQDPVIKLEVDDEGHVTVEVSGAQGPACLALTKELEESLGTLCVRNLKPECTKIDLSSAQKQGQSLNTGL